MNEKTIEQKIAEAEEFLAGVGEQVEEESCDRPGIIKPYEKCRLDPSEMPWVKKPLDLAFVDTGKYKAVVVLWGSYQWRRDTWSYFDTENRVYGDVYEKQYVSIHSYAEGDIDGVSNRKAVLQHYEEIYSVMTKEYYPGKADRDCWPCDSVAISSPDSGHIRIALYDKGGTEIAYSIRMLFPSKGLPGAKFGCAVHGMQKNKSFPDVEDKPFQGI